TLVGVQMMAFDPHRGPGALERDQEQCDDDQRADDDALGVVEGHRDRDDDCDEAEHHGDRAYGATGHGLGDDPPPTGNGDEQPDETEDDAGLVAVEDDSHGGDKRDRGDERGDGEAASARGDARSRHGCSSASSDAASSPWMAVSAVSMLG